MKTLITVLLSAASLITLLGSPNPRTAVADRTLTFAERVSDQRAIEEVYWRHRIWPKDRLDPKPSLDAVMSSAQLEKKVEDYLRDSLMLEDHWQKLITAEQLQAEMDRMARDTKRPEVLRELFEALGNDPTVIAECLARPILAGRLISDLSAQGQTRWFHSPRTDNLRTVSFATMLAQVAYTLPAIASSSGSCTDDTWTPTTVSNAPTARNFHTAVWTGTEMIIWGGYGYPNNLNTGGRYNPGTDSWTATGMINVPESRQGHTAVWTGSEMIVWGGNSDFGYLNTGGRYNPGTDSWTTTSTTNAPEGRDLHTTVWTGSEMIVWGGHIYDGNSYYLNSGGRYNPGTDSWTATSMINVPESRNDHTAVWNGSEMIVWGGADSTSRYSTGGRYNPGTNRWTATSTTNVPDPRTYHTTVWTGSQMIVWGGYDNVFGYLNTGGAYCAESSPPPTPTPTATPTATATPTPTPTATATATPTVTPTGSGAHEGLPTLRILGYGPTLAPRLTPVPPPPSPRRTPRPRPSP